MAKSEALDNIYSLLILNIKSCNAKRRRQPDRGTQRRFPHIHWKHFFSYSLSTFSSIEMHSKRNYKIGIRSAILGELESFRNYEEFRIIFSKNFRCNLTYYEGDNFSDSFFHHFFVIQSIFRPLEMHSKWRYKIYICSVILVELECFRN